MTENPKKEKQVFPPVVSSILAILDRHQAHYLLDQGTLLGVIRAGRMIPGDTDIDISLLACEVQDKLDSIVADIRKLKLPVARLEHCLWIPWTFKGSERENMPVHINFYRRKNGRAEKVFYLTPRSSTPLKRVVWKVFTSFWYVSKAPDIWKEVDKSFLSAKERFALLVARFMPASLRAALLRWVEKCKKSFERPIKMSVPAEYFDNLKEIEIDKIAVKVPYDAEGYLRFKYGPTWRAPAENWKWWLDDRAVIREEDGKRKRSV